MQSFSNNMTRNRGTGIGIIDTALRNKANPTPLQPIGAQYSNPASKASNMTPIPQGGGYTKPVIKTASAPTPVAKPVTAPVAPPKTTVVPTPIIPPTQQQTPPQPQPTAPQPYNPITPYQQSVQGLNNIGQGQIPQNAQTAQGGLVAQSQNNPVSSQTGLLNDIAKNGTQRVNDANDRLQKFQQDNPYMLAAQSNPNVAANVASGRTSLLGQIFGKEEQALATAQQNALSQQGQQINAANDSGGLANTNQAQQINAGVNLGSQALTGQNQQINALNNAGNLAQPTQVPYNTQYIDPTTGKPIGGGQVGQLPNDAQNIVNTYAQQVKDGKMTRADAESKLNAYGVAGTNALTSALGAGFNTNVSTANAGSVGELTQQKNQLQSIFNGAKNNFQLAINTAQKGGVNNGNIPALNALQQGASKGLTSNQAVIDFQNTIATVRGQYAQILGGGNATVDSNQRAAQAIPDNISLNALKSLGDQLEKESANRIGGIDSQISSLSNQSGSQTGSQSGSQVVKNSDGTLKAVDF